MSQELEFALLKLRNKIADKEFVIACANMETSREGWTCDWNNGMSNADKEVLASIDEVERIRHQ